MTRDLTLILGCLLAGFACGIVASAYSVIRPHREWIEATRNDWPRWLD